MNENKGTLDQFLSVIGQLGNTAAQFYGASKTGKQQQAQQPPPPPPAKDNSKMFIFGGIGAIVLVLFAVVLGRR